MELKSIYFAMEIWGALFCLIVAACLVFSRLKDGRVPKFLIAMELCVSEMLAADAFAWAFRGEPGQYSYDIVRISNFLSFLFNYLIMLTFAEFAKASANDDNEMNGAVESGGRTSRAGEGTNRAYGVKKRSWMDYTIYVIGLVQIILLIVTQFNGLFYYVDADNFYHRGRFHWLSQAPVLLANGLILIRIVQNRRSYSKSRFLALVMYLLIPTFLVLVQTFVYGFSLSNIGIAVVSVFIFWEVLLSQVQRIGAQSAMIRQQREALRDMQTKIALSQIKPHFIFNVLNSIYILCDMDVERGKAAINAFSDYLRTNIESIETDVPIPFERELSHVREYLSLEKMRYPGKLDVVYRIHASDFYVPALTVQPIVENAVRHGICQKRDGGTVCITAEKADGEYCIVVEDDGVGFNPAVLSDDEVEHIGIRNVRERVRLLVHGEVEVVSRVGEGTRVVIRIPRDNFGPKAVEHKV